MFDLTALNNDQYLVEGSDIMGVSGQQVLDGTQWNEVKRRAGADTAKAELDQALAEFFKPISDALDAAKDAVAVTPDDLAYVVVKEPVKGTKSTVGEVVYLTEHSQIIRAIEEGQHMGRLRWVNDSLVILAP